MFQMRYIAYYLVMIMNYTLIKHPYALEYFYLIKDVSQIVPTPVALQQNAHH